MEHDVENESKKSPNTTHVIGRIWTFEPVTVDDVSYAVPVAEETSGLWVDASEFLLGLGYNKNTLTKNIYSIINSSDLVQDKDYTIFQVYEDDIVPISKYAFSIDTAIAICKASPRNETSQTAVPFLEQARNTIVRQATNESSLLNAFVLLDVIFPLDLLAYCMREHGYNDSDVSKESLLLMFTSDGLLSKRKSGHFIRRKTQGLFRKINNDIMCSPHGFCYLLRKYAGLTSAAACATAVKYSHRACLLKTCSLFERERSILAPKT